MQILCTYCQGVTTWRYQIACLVSADTLIILCKEKGLRLWRCSATATFVWHLTQVGSKLPGTCTISSVVNLQNLLCTTLVVRVVFNLKTKLLPPGSLLHIQEKPDKYSDAESSSSQALQPVVSNVAGYNLAQDKIIYIWDVQRRKWAI